MFFLIVHEKNKCCNIRSGDRERGRKREREKERVRELGGEKKAGKKKESC